MAVSGVLVASWAFADGCMKPYTSWPALSLHDGSLGYSAGGAVAGLCTAGCRVALAGSDTAEVQLPEHARVGGGCVSTHCFRMPAVLLTAVRFSLAVVAWQVAWQLGWSSPAGTVVLPTLDVVPLGQL